MRRIYIVIPSLFIVGGLMVVLATRHRANVTLVMSPGVATAVLDNKQPVHEGKFYVSPGKHTIRAKFAGFADNSVSFTSGKTAQTVNLLLEPNSSEGYAWLAGHPDEQKKREGVGGPKFNNDSQKQLSNYPIIADLPYIERYFRVDYGASKAHPKDTTAVGIYVTYYADIGKQQALDWITQQGYDPAQLEIIYINQATLSSPDS